MLVVEILMSQGDSALRLVIRKFPIGIEDLGSRSQVRGRIAVTIKTPTHRERRGLPHQRHAPDRAVARRAADALGDMDRVIEIDVAWQTIDLIPMNGLVVGKTFTNGRQHRRLRIKLGMAGHAGVARRDARDRRSFDTRVTVTAIKTEASYMMGVAERDRLIDRYRLVGRIFGGRHPITKSDQQNWHNSD